MSNYNPFSLKGKSILVTGASSGLGKAIAIQCSKMGSRVVITGRDSNRLNETYRKLEGKDHLQFLADLTNKESLTNMVDKVPYLDGLVNNAGISKRLLVKDITENALARMMESNFSSSIMLSRLLLKKRKINEGASIVFISSRGADRPTVGNAMYSASKGAINSFSKVMALELAPKLIRVNCVQPGMVWTPLLEHSSLSIDQYKEDEKRYPLGRYGQPNDVAYSVLYLLSNASGWMTGSSITIDGGVSLR